VGGTRSLPWKHPQLLRRDVRTPCPATPSRALRPASLPGPEGIGPGYARLRGSPGMVPAGPHPGLRQPKGDPMPLYECVLMARNDVTQQQVETIADTVEQTLKAGGGEVRKREYWGLRGLAYKIKKNRKAHYMLLGVNSPPAAIQEVERQLGLHEDVLRTLTIRVDAIEEGQSAILARRGEDRERERGFRGPRPAGRFGSGRGGSGGGGRERDDREEFRARPREELDPGMDVE